MIVAVTGYIGAGKSTTAQMMSQHDYIVIEADQIGHDLLARDDILEHIRSEFGIKVLGRDLKVDREKLAKAVFSNIQMLAKLNKIVHPALKQEIVARVQDLSGNIAVDAALYHELELDTVCDKAILVTTDIGKVYERLNPDYTQEEILNIMNSQRLCAKPDFTIDNNGNLEQLRSRVAQIVKLLGT